MSVNKARTEIPPGTLEMLILQSLARQGQMHGFEIARAIQQRSSDVLKVEEGSLYPALQRMLLKAWVHPEWGTTTENRRARYYHLTRSGHRQLGKEVAQYRRVTLAIEQVLQPA
jgi:PadR family transcriptional regulator PadR